MVLQKAVLALNQHPIYVMVSPTGRIHGYRNHRVEKVPLTFTPRDTPGKILLSVPFTLSSDLQVLVPEECSPFR